MVKKLLHPKAVLEAVVAFHVVKAKDLFLVVLGSMFSAASTWHQEHIPGLSRWHTGLQEAIAWP